MVNELFDTFPRYICHKEVRALEIEKVVRDTDIAAASGRSSDGSALLIPKDKAYLPIRVEKPYVDKHNPQAGGYFVVYDDGYTSFSPAEPFKAGYTPMQGNPAGGVSAGVATSGYVAGADVAPTAAVEGGQE